MADMIGYFIVLYTLLTATRAEYPCVCSYTIEQKVYNTPNTNANVIGYMYEFDCKKSTTVAGLDAQKFFAIEFQKQLGYVAHESQIQSQVCPGDPSPADLIPTTTSTKATKANTVVTDTLTTVASTKPSTMSTSSTSTPSTPTPSTSTSTSTSTSSTTSTTATPTTTPTTSSATTSTQATPPSTFVPTTTTTTTTTIPSTSTSTTASTSSTTSTTTTQTLTTSSATTSTPTTTTLPSSTSTTTTTASTTPSTVSPTTTMSSTTSTSTTTTTKATTTTTLMTTLPSLRHFNTSGSPLAYLGTSYNLLQGNPSGMDKSKNGIDPGLLVSRRIFQLIESNNPNVGIPEGTLVVTQTTCSTGSTSTVVHDGKSYQQELLQFVKQSGSALTTEAFTLNTEFLQVRQHTEAHSSGIYQDITSSCSLGEMRMVPEKMANDSKFPVSRDFAEDVCKLPQMYNDDQYMAFLDKWGTDIVMSAEYGTLTVSRYKTNGQQLLNHLQKQGAGDIIYPSGVYDGYPSSVAINSTKLSTTKIPRFGVLVRTHQMGTKLSPVPVNITLFPLTEALKAKYWRKVLRQEMFTDVCTDNFDEAALHQVSANVGRALKQYITHSKMNMSNLKPITDHPVVIPMVWPRGTYGLMMAASGCPGSTVAWASGYRTYDTEDSNSHSYYSNNVQNYLAGSFGSSNLQTKFCMKAVESTNSLYDKAWPSGSYCILKRGNCPSASNLQIPLTWPHGYYGFTQTAFGCPKGNVAWKFGYRKFDTEDDHGHNYFSPGIQQFLSGSYATNNILTNFCMKTVVTTDSLYDRRWQSGTYCVYMYGSCPKGFSSGYIFWDDDDGGLFNSNHNAAGGVLPTGDYGVNTKISFCCRQDAPSSTKMYMPREVPFVLMRYGSACQEVHDMEVRELFARWDDEDSHNHESAGGAHPTDTGGKHDHLLYFCYYSQIKHGSNAVMAG